MPLPISLAHKLAKRLTDVRKDGTLTICVPTARARSPWSMTRTTSPSAWIRWSSPPSTARRCPSTQIREDMIEQVVKTIIPSHLLDENTKYFINPTGRFVIGGPHGDSGLTGRKIIVDTYGGMRPPRRRRVLRQGPDQGGPLAARMRPARSPRTSWPQVWPSAARCSWPTPSAWPSRFPSW